MALQLGCTVRELLARISSSELKEWAAYFCIEPWGELRMDQRVALIRSTQANCHKAKHQRVFTAEDFLPVEPEQEYTKPATQKEIDRNAAEFGKALLGKK